MPRGHFEAEDERPAIEMVRLRAADFPKEARAAVTARNCAASLRRSLRSEPSTDRMSAFGMRHPSTAGPLSHSISLSSRWITGLWKLSWACTARVIAFISPGS